MPMTLDLKPFLLGLVCDMLLAAEHGLENLEAANEDKIEAELKKKLGNGFVEPIVWAAVKASIPALFAFLRREIQALPGKFSTPEAKKELIARAVEHVAQSS